MDQRRKVSKVIQGTNNKKREGNEVKVDENKKVTESELPIPSKIWCGKDKINETNIGEIIGKIVQANTKKVKL